MIEKSSILYISLTSYQRLLIHKIANRFNCETKSLPQAAKSEESSNPFFDDFVLDILKLAGIESCENVLVYEIEEMNLKKEGKKEGKEYLNIKSVLVSKTPESKRPILKFTDFLYKNQKETLFPQRKNMNR